MCGELRVDDAGRRVTVAGWADTRRDHGGLVFVDLRDAAGKVQLVLNPDRPKPPAELAHELRNEFVLQAPGGVVGLPAVPVTPTRPTGRTRGAADRLGTPC